MPNPSSSPKRLVYRDLREVPRFSAARYRPITGILLSAFWDEIYREGRNTRLTFRRSTEDKPPGLSGETAPPAVEYCHNRLQRVCRDNFAYRRDSSSGEWDALSSNSNPAPRKQDRVRRLRRPQSLRPSSSPILMPTMIGW